jgi:CRP-like cAMP-binding protein
MDKGLLIDFIKNHIPASEEILLKIAAQFEEKFFFKNDYFLKEGKVSNYLFLAEGFMRAFTFDPEGNEITTYFYPRDRVVFEASSFFMRTVSTENIQAVTDCKGYFTNFEKLNVLFHSTPEFREFGRLILVKEFVAYKQRTLAMINKSAEERYADLIHTNKEIFQYAQLKHIASYLGMTDTSLSRIRKEFSKK